MTYICPCCGAINPSIKDNDKFSSLMCNNKVLIYYYGNKSDAEITAEERRRYMKDKKIGMGFELGKQ